MALRVDFPYPPQHYRALTAANWREVPPVEALLSATRSLRLFGQEEPLTRTEPLLAPNFLLTCEHSFFAQKPLRLELLHLHDVLCRLLDEYLAALASETERLGDLARQLLDLLGHVFYLLKLARNTLQAPLELGVLYRAEAAAVGTFNAELRACAEQLSDYAPAS